MNVTVKFIIEESYFCRNIYFDFLSELNNAKFHKKNLEQEIKYLISEIQDSFESKEKKVIDIVSLQSKTNELNFLTKYFTNLFYSNKLFIPEFLNIDLLKERTLEEIKNLLSNGISVYISEFHYREIQSKNIYDLFRTNKEIINNERLKEIINPNSEKTTNLNLEDLDFLNDFLNDDNNEFDTKKLGITNNDNIKNLHSKLRKLDNNSKLEYYNQNKEKIIIKKVKCFFGRNINYIDQEGFLVEFDNGDFIYYENSPYSRDIIVLNIGNKIFTYWICNWGSFINLIENFKGIYKKMDKLPKYEMMDKEYKTELKKHLNLN